MRDKTLEDDFENLIKCVSLVYSARQSAKLKRRWPLSKVIVAAPKKICKAIQSLNEVLLEPANTVTIHLKLDISTISTSQII